MALPNKVVWNEGMFIHPQHFQQQDRYLEQLLINHRDSLNGYHWGLIDYKLDTALLQTGSLVLNEGYGVLPDGALFNVPVQNKAPLPLAVPPNTQNQRVYLGLPLSQAGSSEITTSPHHLARFLLHEQAVIDVAATNGNAVNIPTAQFNLKLLLENEDRRQFSCLPIARVLDVTHENKIILDKEFIPPCLDIQASRNLVDYLREINALIRHRAQILAKRVGDINRSNSAMADFLLLQILNRFSSLFEHLQKKPRLHPETLYSLFLQLAGELATFTDPDKQPSKLGDYQHNDLQNTFNPVINSLRFSLSRVMNQAAFVLRLENHQHGLFVAPLADHTWLTTHSFVLAASATLPLETILTRLPAQIKIGAVEQIHQLINAQLPGVKLKTLATVPPQIPYNMGYSYFRLEFLAEQIKQLNQSGGLALQISGDFPELKLELWIIKE